MARRLFHALAALSVTIPAQGVTAASLQTVEPRAFGYSVGDSVERRLIVDLPAPLADTALPKPGRRGGLELRSVRMDREATTDGMRHDIHLRYQVFVAPPETRALVLPGLVLSAGGDTVSVPEHRIYVAPLVPPDFASDSALGTMRPDVAPPAIDTRAAGTRLVALAGLSLLLACWLAWRQFGDLLLARPRGPFERAWRDLRRLDPRAADAGRMALRRLHRAFDECAGTTLFVEGLDAFIALRPEFAPQADAIRSFFATSRRAFFAAAGEASAADLAAALALGAACRAVERSRR